MFARTTGLLGLVAVAGTAAVADDGCSVYRLNIPDLDQVRRASGNIAGLPNDGRMFCAPTSVCNVIGYLNNIGFPNLCLGPKDWQNDYPAGTAYINYTNSFCQVDPQDGGSMTPGFGDYLDTHYPDEFVVTRWDGTNGGPTPQAMYGLMTYGCMMTFSYGRYERVEASGDLPARRVRGGGHCVTLSSVINGCTDPVLGFRNPSSGDSETVQSPFATQKLPVRPWTTYWAGNDTDTPKFKTIWIFDEEYADGRLRAIDGLAIMWPLDGLSIDAEQGILTAQKYIDLNMGLTNGVRPTHLLLPAVQAAREAAMRRHPHLPEAVVMIDGERGGRDQPGIWRADLARQEWRRVGDVSPIPPCFGPDGRLFVARDGRIEGLDLDDSAAPLVRQTREHILLAMATSDTGVDGDRSDYELVLLTRSAAGGVRVAVADVTGDGIGEIDPQPLPTAVQIPAGAEIAASPIDGSVLIAREGVPGLVRCQRTPGAGWTIAETIPTGDCVPQNPQFDNKGRVVFTCNGVVQMLERTAAGGWREKTDSRWSGYRAGRFFELARGRTGLSIWEGTRGDYNLDPAAERRVMGGDEMRDCAADFNNDGFIDFFDYADFVHCFEGDLTACPANNPAQMVLDMNGDGFLDFFDYDAFVVAFERGC